MIIILKKYVFKIKYNIVLKCGKLAPKNPSNVKSPQNYDLMNIYNEYINQVEENILENPAEFWSYAKIKQKKTKYPIEMHYDGRKSDTPEGIVESFADYFESV